MRFRIRARRRTLLAALGLALLAGGLLGAAGAAAPDPISVSATVSPVPTGAAMPSGFVGFSLEYSAIHRYLGRDARHLNPLFLDLVRGVNPAGAPVLRIGGDSSDHTWWPLPDVIEPVGVSYPLTPDWTLTVHRMAAELGARLILGINLAADSPQLAAVEARALIDRVGGQYIDALEIGNEPDVYTRFAWYRTRTGQVGFARGGSWDESAFASEFRRWAGALPDVPLAGPAEAYPDWMAQLSGLIASSPHLRVVTFHRYPLRGCGSQDSGSLAATIPNLLDDASSTGLAQSVAPFVSVAHAHRLPFRVDELNSASCGGSRGTSDTFASSLWILDTLFQMASVGVDGVNIHTLPGAAYAPFAFFERGRTWHATVNPIYYGLWLFSRAFPAGSHLTAASSSSAGVKAYATVTPAGAVHTVLINETGQPAVVRLHVDGHSTRPATLEGLTAPSLSATAGVAIGGQSFAPGTTQGTLAAPHTTTVSPLLGVYRISVPADSAMLVTS